MEFINWLEGHREEGELSGVAGALLSYPTCRSPPTEGTLTSWKLSLEEGTMGPYLRIRCHGKKRLRLHVFPGPVHSFVWFQACFPANSYLSYKTQIPVALYRQVFSWLLSSPRVSGPPHPMSALQ